MFSFILSDVNKHIVQILWKNDKYMALSTTDLEYAFFFYAESMSRNKKLDFK